MARASHLYSPVEEKDQMYVRSLSGHEGGVTLPLLGAKIGDFSTWSLRRREEAGPLNGTFSLSASFSYFNPILWGMSELTREIRVSLGKKQYRLDLVEAGSVEVISNRLIAQGVTLCPL
jgi:hypothetical protein